MIASIFFMHFPFSEESSLLLEGATARWEPASLVAAIMHSLARRANHKLSISIIESLRWHSQSSAAKFLRQAPFSLFLRPLGSRFLQKWGKKIRTLDELLLGDRT